MKHTPIKNIYISQKHTRMPHIMQTRIVTQRNTCNDKEHGPTNTEQYIYIYNDNRYYQDTKTLNIERAIYTNA